jgi:alternate signal-mediated exported protein
MITKHKQKAAAGAAAAALLLLGGVYAWSSTNQHKTNEFSNKLNDNDVTLIEDFEPVNDWLQGQEINKDISVKNNTTAATGSNAYIRISLKEFLEFTNKTEELSKIRYAITTAGDFAKFGTQAEAQAYADANGLGNPEYIESTAFEGDKQWFIPTQADATHGQYGKFLVLKVGDGTSKSIIDETVANASADAGTNHHDPTNGEDAYTTQLFSNGGADINGARYYDPVTLVTDYPTGGGIEPTKDLKDYITWTFGADVTTLDAWKNSAEDSAPTAKWIIDTDTGYVYWGQVLAPGTTTAKFLDSVTLTQAPKNVALYYAIHTNLEAVDYNEIGTLAPPAEIEEAWKSQKFTVTFNSNGGDTTPDPQGVKEGKQATAPTGLTKNDGIANTSSNGVAPNTDFIVEDWYTDAALTQVFDFSTPITSDMTLYAKWELPITEAGTNDNLASFADDTLGTVGDKVWFSNAWYRILKDDMNDKADDGKQALVLKVDALTNEEAKQSGTPTATATLPFHELGHNTYFLDDTTSTGYDVSLLKKTIDAYYVDTIKGTDNEKYIQAVSLNHPTYNELKEGQTFSGSAYNKWNNWTDFYKDTRFATELGDSKQGFALSYGDIHTINSVGASDNRTPLLDFAGATGTNNYTWLRSAGYGNSTAGAVYTGSIQDYLYVRTGLPVRVALSLQIK